MNSEKNILSTKYFILLASLSFKEKEALLELASCYSFNPSPKILMLISLTTKEQILTKKSEIYTKIFPNTEYDDRKLRNILSRAFFLIEKFLGYQYFEKNSSKFQAANVLSLEEKNLDSFVDSKIDKWKKNVNEQTIYHDDYFNEKMDCNDIAFHRNLKLLSSKTRNFKLSSKEYNKSLDEYFLLKKMKLFISSFNYQSMVNVEEDFTMLEEIITFIESKNDWNPIIKVYYHLLMIHYKPELDINFNSLKGYYEFIDSFLPIEQKREIYLLIQNFTIKNINAGKSDYLIELLTLFKIMLKNKTIFIEDKLSQWSYKNITTVALRLNETKWCIGFIEEFKEKLEKKERNTTYALVKAKYFFFTKEFLNAMKIIEDSKFDDTLSLINAKIIQLKIYYELNDYDNMILAIESLDKFLLRKKILTEVYLKRFKNFSKYLKKIISTNTKKPKEKLLEKLQSIKAINNKKWLIEKLSEK